MEYPMEECSLRGGDTADEAAAKKAAEAEAKALEDKKAAAKKAKATLGIVNDDPVKKKSPPKCRTTGICE